MSRVLLVALLALAAPLRAQDGGADDAGADDAGAVDDDAGAAPEDAGADDAGAADDDAGAAPDDAGADDDDAGADDADAGGCGFDPFCEDADTLVYCDGVDAVTLACADVHEGARCGLLDEVWGEDCLLPGGAPCARGYADGASRCDPDDAPFCGDDGTCGDEASGDPAPLEPTDGSGALVPQDGAPQNTLLSCLGCGSQQSAGLVVGLALARALRRRRR